MTKYDDASWHYEGNYPEDLPPENGATHIGMFLAWCIEHNLVSKRLIEDCADDIQKVKNKAMTGAQFLILNCDEKLLDEDLSDIGQAFANAYYEDNGTFAQTHQTYIQDYCDVFNQKAQEAGFEYDSVYHVKDLWANYKLIAAKLSERFAQYRREMAAAEQKSIRPPPA